MKNTLLLLSLLAIAFSSCTTEVPESVPDTKEHIRFNQVGYYPKSIKEFVVADYKATSFLILNDKGKKVYVQFKADSLNVCQG